MYIQPIRIDDAIYVHLRFDNHGCHTDHHHHDHEHTGIEKTSSLSSLSLFITTMRKILILRTVLIIDQSPGRCVSRDAPGAYPKTVVSLVVVLLPTSEAILIVEW